MPAQLVGLVDKLRGFGCPKARSAFPLGGSDRGAEPPLELAHGVHEAPQAPGLVQLSSASPSCIGQHMERAPLCVASVARVVHGKSFCSELAQSDLPEHIFTRAIRVISCSWAEQHIDTVWSALFALRLSFRT